MEKLVLALVHASRRLRRYFQGHPINILTDYKIQNVLRKPELSGRLAKWAIELGEHTLFYKSRPAIKGQVLVDFVAEIPEEKVEETQMEVEPQEKVKGRVWKLYTDGAANDEGCGAGLCLISSEGHEFTYAIKLYFKSTNNEAEYEALLAGLRIATKMGADNLEAHVDSMLVAGQVNGVYDAKEESMALYLEQVKNLMKQFSSCAVIHINRSDNKSANALSKMASTSFGHFGKEVRIEVLRSPSVPAKQTNTVEDKAPTWMTPIMAYLASGALPDNKAEAQKIQHKAL